jgi:hypothetical protein
MKNRSLHFQNVVTMFLMVASSFFLSCLQGCKARAEKDADDQAEKPGVAAAATAPASIRVENGRVVLSLDSQSQNRLGLGMVTVSETLVRPQFSVPAVVLPVQDLANLRSNYAAARAQLQKTQTNLDVATKEYQRLKILYQENQNASAKALEAAQGTMQVDKADETAARQQVDLPASLIREQWGAAVAEWVTGNADALNGILSDREILVQITIPPDRALSSPPQTISLEVPGGAARFGKLRFRVPPCRSSDSRASVSLPSRFSTRPRSRTEPGRPSHGGKADSRNRCA